MNARSSSILRLALTVTVFALGSFGSTACSHEPSPECKEKFVTMLAPCVPKCEGEDPSGVGTDDCIRSCVQEEFGEPVPQC